MIPQYHVWLYGVHRRSYPFPHNKGIMHKISPLVGPLRATPPIIGSEEERARREYTVQMSKRGLIDLCQQEASKFLVQGRYDLAVPGAIQVIIYDHQIDQ